MKIFKSFFFWVGVIAVILLIAYRKQLKKWLEANTPEGTVQTAETAADKLANVTAETANTALAAIHKVASDLLKDKANNQVFEITDYVDLAPIAQKMIKPSGFIPKISLAERIFVRSADEVDVDNPLRLTRENAWWPRQLYKERFPVPAKTETLLNPGAVISHDEDCKCGCGAVIIQVNE